MKKKRLTKREIIALAVKTNTPLSWHPDGLHVRKKPWIKPWIHPHANLPVFFND